jgi:hypothetical protein
VLANRQGQDRRWLISDFVTVGSPLTHAEFLIAASEKDLEDRKFQRELPQSPPLREKLDPNTFELAKGTRKLPVGNSHEASKLVSFPLQTSPGVWELHHAAPFAAVRWTNIHDPASLVYRGDIIGGRVADHLGPGIIEVDLKSLRGQALEFTHTKYWEIDGEPMHIDALRWAINLLDQELPDQFVPGDKAGDEKFASIEASVEFQALCSTAVHHSTQVALVQGPSALSTRREQSSN